MRGLTSPGRFRVGCSGWQYRHWRGNFYPPRLPQKRWFDHYTSVFDRVEVNNTFYRLPEATEEPLSRFFERASRLGRKLGPVLYQLPPRWERNLGRLERFLSALPKRKLHAIARGV